jgi:hypothetical protein
MNTRKEIYMSIDSWFLAKTFIKSMYIFMEYKEKTNLPNDNIFQDVFDPLFNDLFNRNKFARSFFY